MDNSSISIVIAVVALIVAAFALWRASQKPVATPLPSNANNTVPLQLGAYERLALLIERITLPNLISRVVQPGMSAAELQLHLIENTKQEFEYNTSQQIYVSPIAWEAVRNLRDQNLLIVNQVAAMLPGEAKASDLAKNILDVIMQQKDAALHTIVQNAVNYEAKKLMA